MSVTTHLHFDQKGLLDIVDAMDDGEIDDLDFGVIGFDAETAVRRYNSFEATMAGLAPARVVGSALFTVVAPCMNNFMVAHRFEEAAAADGALDATIDYLFTLRMRPVKVVLRLLAEPGRSLRYILVNRRV